LARASTLEELSGSPRRHQATGTLSCVVDQDPRFHLEALRWFAALFMLAGVEPSDMRVHVVGEQGSRVLDHLRGNGVVLRRVEPFDPRSPHCNKIAAAQSLAAEGVDGIAVLCDTDVAVLEDPRVLPVRAGTVASKPLDAPCPPLGVVLRAMEAAGLAAPQLVPLPWEPGQRTVAGNGNGGLYLVPGGVLAVVAGAWARWARWLLDRPGLLGSWALYTDQVAMAMALAAEGVEPVALDVRWNTPLHDPSRIPPDPTEPAVIHYHHEGGDDGLVRTTGIPSLDGPIEALNDAAAAVWHDALAGAPGTSEPQAPARSRPTRGGLDVRPPGGQPGARALLDAVRRAVRPASVLEVGPGDDLLGRPLSADLTICLDVLTREPDRAAYRAKLARLWRSARSALLVSGFEQLPSSDRDGYWHEPLSESIGRTAPGAELYPLASDGGVTTAVVLRRPATPHPRDFGSSTLAPLAARHPDPLGLLALRLHAWRYLGFYPDHEPRLWEYPVVARIVLGELAPESRVLDVGAGVTPLPSFLANRGYIVHTLDPSPVRREWPPGPDWNEWEFLDYGRAGLASRSWNCDVRDLPARQSFDGAYSVSVVEHLRAAERRELLGSLASRVRTGAPVVLTVDLERGGDVLWNRSREAPVEEASSHGTLQDLASEAARAGLRVDRVETVREWGGSRVDIGLLVLKRG
jgi:hypothetical protein